MTDVTPNFRTNLGECEGRQESCTLTACPKYGTLGREARDGKRRVKGCGDPVARGKRNRAKGDAKARRARKVLRLPGVNSRHEELTGVGIVKWEAKAGASGGANKVWTAYRNARSQSDAARAIGATEPFVAAFSPDDTSHVLFVVRDDDLEQFVLNLAVAWGFADGGAP